MSAAPVFLLAGGRERRASERGALRSAVAAIGRDAPTLAYVGAASGDSAPFRLLVSRFFRAAGSGRVVPVRLCGRRPDVRAAKDLLDDAAGVLVSGGDVEEGMRVLRETGLTEHLKALADQGKPFVGLSAGSLMLARSWIRWRDPDDDDSGELLPCLGIAPLYCDTHDEDSGWCELKALLGLLPEGEEAWGIPSGGAVITEGGTVRWMGPEPARFKRVGGVPVWVEGPGALDSAG